MQLTQLFNGEFDVPGNVGEVILRRWDVEEKDLDQRDSPDFAARVRARPLATVMSFGDYDHDGRAPNFCCRWEHYPAGSR